MVKNQQFILIGILILVFVGIYFLPKGEVYSVVNYNNQCSLPACSSGYTETDKDCQTSSNTCTRECEKTTEAYCGSWGSWTKSRATISSPTQGTTYFTNALSTTSGVCYLYYGEVSMGVNNWWSADSYKLTAGATSGVAVSTCKTSANSAVTNSNEKLEPSNGDSIKANGKYIDYADSSCSGTPTIRLSPGTMTIDLWYTTATYYPAATLTQEKTCTYTCDQDSECPADSNTGTPYCSGNDVMQAYTDSECQSYTCSASQKARVVTTCSAGCSGGACITAQCNSNSDCGTDGVVGSNFCSGNDLMEQYRTFTCQINHQCTSSTINRIKQTCTSGCSGTACLGTCTEGQVVLISNVYNVCHSGSFGPITNLVLLTPAEQAAVIAQINALNASIQQKAAIIANLTANLNQQISLINQLQLSIDQKAQIIYQLDLTITQQAQIIQSMQLTVEDQVRVMTQLNLTISQQAQMINQLTNNLAIKAALVEQLQAENDEQAQLIAQMQLSFGDQAAILTQLHNTIVDDAQIIANMNLTLSQQAALINQLQLDNQQMAQLIANINPNIAQQAALINQLQLTLQQEEQIIAELRLSIAEEEELVANLQRTIEEQNQIINDLRNGIVSPSFDFAQIWADYKWIIIGVGGVFVVLLLLGGKKR